MSLRAGLDELNPSTASSSLRLGAGYDWKRILGIDYAFSTSPDLGESYRLSLWWTPAFPRFEGRNFRPKPAARRTSASAHANEVQPAQENIPDAGEKLKPQPETAPSDSGKGEEKEILEDN